MDKNIELVKFGAKEATDIGKIIIEKAINEKRALCISIYINGRELFRFLSDECTPNHEQWLNRKRNTVLFFHQSTKFIGEKLNQDSSLLRKKYGLNEQEHTVVSGGIPIIVKGCGVIGALCISGMMPQEDHDLAVEMLSLKS